jgi:hypothetical protein
VGLGDALKRLTGRRDEGELFSIPEDGKLGATTPSVNPAPVVPSAIPGPSPTPAAAAPPPAEPADSAFETALRTQMEAQGIDPATAEASAERAEQALKGALGGNIPGTAEVSIATSSTSSAPFMGFVTGASQDPPAAAPAAAEDPLDQIAKLAALRDKKVLTEVEFQAAKAKLLGES